MDARLERELFGKFLATAVAEYKDGGGSLTFRGSSAEIVQRFERLLGVAALNGNFHSLTFQQCDQCLNELLGDAALVSGVFGQTFLLQCVVATKWRIGGQEVATDSRILLYYGQRAIISTFLQFETIEQFHYVQAVLADLGLCKLNEQHLKLVKTKKAKPKG